MLEPTPQQKRVAALFFIVWAKSTQLSNTEMLEAINGQITLYESVTSDDLNGFEANGDILNPKQIEIVQLANKVVSLGFHKITVDDFTNKISGAL